MTNDPNGTLPPVPTFELTSPDFDPGGPLPQWARSAILSAGGEDRSPALRWAGAPAETRSFVLTVLDPDAPAASGFWHWAVVDLPGTLESLPQNAGDPDAGLLPEGAITHPMELGLARYVGAGPPPGHGPHRYYFTLSALDVEHLDVPPDATPAVVNLQLRDHLIGRAQLVGMSETSA